MAGASDPRFADVERQYYALKGQLSGGQLTRDQFEAALQKLMILDAQSRYWMMGAETGKWYVYDGQNWQQSNPPASAAPAAPRAAVSAAGVQPDSATLASFTPPAAAAAVPVTPDSAPTMSFTPPAAAAAAPVTPDAAPTMSFTPPAAEPSAPVSPDAAPTMSFTPSAEPSAPVTFDAAPTMLSTPPAAVAAGSDTPDAAPTVSFTSPAEPSAAMTPASAPTMSLTPSAEPSAPVTPDAAPTMTFIPPARQGGEAGPDSALTMASFTPPAASKTPPDRAATVAAFTPPKVAAAGTSSPARAVPAAAAGGRKLSPVLLLGCLFAIVCVGGIVALAVAVNSRFGNAPDLATPAAIVTAATATTAAAATNTTAPLNTSVSAATSAPANTPLPAQTSTPLPAPSSTPTARPQPNPPVVSPATAIPSQTPQPSTPTTEPTATDTPVPVPTRPLRPAVEFPVSFSYVGYEKWGRPNGDFTQFNNKDAVRQFKWEESVTNRTAVTITGADWSVPTVTNNEGTRAAVFAYGSPDIPPGQTTKVTYAAYVELNQFVQRIQHQIRNTTYIRCLDGSPSEVTC